MTCSSKWHTAAPHGHMTAYLQGRLGNVVQLKERRTDQGGQLTVSSTQLSSLLFDPLTYWRLAVNTAL